MERKIVAIIGVDDDTAFKKIDDGPVPYLEKEFGLLEQSGISLNGCFVADDDEDDKWQAYLNYLVEWVFNHQGEEFAGTTPACYDEFGENECPCGGDSTNDGEGCADSGDYHCVNGECVARNICPDCGAEMKVTPNPPHIRFCPSCGNAERTEKTGIGRPSCKGNDKIYSGATIIKLKPGVYVAENKDSVWDAYYIEMKVKETEKSYIFELVTFDSRYSGNHIQMLFEKSNRFVLVKNKGGHAMRVWGDDNFTIYPFQSGVPYFFKMKG